MWLEWRVMCPLKVQNIEWEKEKMPAFCPLPSNNYKGLFLILGRLKLHDALAQGERSTCH